jgi:hypothetical protein
VKVTLLILPRLSMRNLESIIVSTPSALTQWIMSSEQFIAEALQGKTGKNVGRRSIWFNGTKIDPATNKKSNMRRSDTTHTLHTIFPWSPFRQPTTTLMTKFNASPDRFVGKTFSC